MSQFVRVGRVRLPGHDGQPEGSLAVFGQRPFSRLGEAVVVQQQRLVERGQQLLQHARPDAQSEADGECRAQTAAVPRPVAQRQHRSQLLWNHHRLIGQLQWIAQQDTRPAALDDRADIYGSQFGEVTM